MNRLPREILLDILDRLLFKDKLQCALSCRDWYTKIFDTALYSKVKFRCIQSDDRTKVQIKYMRDKGLGRQVVDLCIDDIDDPLELSELFPNVKSLQMRSWEDYERKGWSDEKNASLVQNWNTLEAIHERFTNCLLTMRLLDAPSNMMSLSSLTIHFGHLTREVQLQFVNQLKHATALERLSLTSFSHSQYKTLDLLHKNTPNLKHLDLINLRSLFVEEGHNLEEYHPLPMDPSFAVSNLRSFCAEFVYEEDRSYLKPHSWDINDLHWMEYICHKYTNLTSIVVNGLSTLASQHLIDIKKGYIKKAFRNWTQLKEFNMVPIPLDEDILQTMDACNISLKELKLYVFNRIDKAQLIFLARSKQRNSINKLAIYDDSKQSLLQDKPLIYFLLSLDTNNCQLNELDFEDIYPSDRERPLTSFHVLLCAPSLKRLSMPWVGTMESSLTTAYNQTTHLTHLNLTLHQRIEESLWVDHTLQYIQSIVTIHLFCSYFILIS